MLFLMGMLEAQERIPQASACVIILVISHSQARSHGRIENPSLEKYSLSAVSPGMYVDVQNY